MAKLEELTLQAEPFLMVKKLNKKREKMLCSQGGGAICILMFFRVKEG